MSKRKHTKYMRPELFVEHEIVAHERPDGRIVHYKQKTVNREGRKRSKPLVYSSHNKLADALNGREKLLNFVAGRGLKNDAEVKMKWFT